MSDIHMKSSGFSLRTLGGAALLSLAIAAAAPAEARSHRSAPEAPAAASGAVGPTLAPADITGQAKRPDVQAQLRRLNAEPPVSPPRGHRLAIDHSGRRQQGKASFYASNLKKRKMASGRLFDPSAPVAASKGLPLGTEAKVTNLENGRSTTVKVEDRGPYVDGRVMDLSPKSAAEIGIDHKAGVAPVIVAPITVPQPDGSVKGGAGLADLR